MLHLRQFPSPLSPTPLIISIDMVPIPSVCMYVSGVAIPLAADSRDRQTSKAVGGRLSDTLSFGGQVEVALMLVLRFLPELIQWVSVWLASWVS